jgi:hypothetical protein
MTQTQPKTEHVSFSDSTDVRQFDNGRLEMLRIGGSDVGLLTVRPGWRWSNDVKPIAGTEWCQAPHFGYMISGSLHIKMQDGSEFDLTPGTAYTLPSGHDAWVLGDQEVVTVDWQGASTYAKK